MAKSVVRRCLASQRRCGIKTAGQQPDRHPHEKHRTRPNPLRKGRRMRFEVVNQTWHLYADNNKQVAWAGESFDSAANAERAARDFKAGAKTARYETFKDSGGDWRWRAWRSSDKVAASGESFYSESNAERAYENVRDNAGSATGP
jgi:uncharacterized protein